VRDLTVQVALSHIAVTTRLSVIWSSSAGIIITQQLLLLLLLLCVCVCVCVTGAACVGCRYIDVNLISSLSPNLQLLTKLTSL